jgi:signal transduction histidine kinase
LEKKLKTGIQSLLLTFVLSLGASLLAALLLPHAIFYTESFHSAIEAIGGFAGLSLSALILFLLRYTGYSSERVWIACGLIAMGILDIFHASSSAPGAFVWLRSMSTCIGGFFFALTILPERLFSRRTALVLPASVALAAIILSIFSIRFPGLLPVMAHEGAFTGSAKFIHILGAIFFLLASGHFFKKYLALNTPAELIFSNFCLLFSLAGLLFLFSGLWMAQWWLWHFLRLSAYLISLPFTFLLFRKVEEDLQRAVAKLRASNADLENFAYAASHDLKEPLLGIASDLKLLEKHTKESLPPESSSLLQDALQMTMRLQAMISDLLAYSRIGTQVKAFEPCDLNAVLQESLENLRVQIEQSGAQITHDSLPRVIADPLQLLQLFQNLISNGIKFRGEEPPRIHVSARREDRKWRFSVRDNGIGIPPEQRERIFEIFKRLHKEKYPGTGIGLAVCKKIVERHGGRIWAESEPGKGSTFYFTIPDRQEQVSFTPAL